MDLTYTIASQRDGIQSPVQQSYGWKANSILRSTQLRESYLSSVSPIYQNYPNKNINLK